MGLVILVKRTVRLILSTFVGLNSVDHDAGIAVGVHGLLVSEAFLRRELGPLHSS